MNRYPPLLFTLILALDARWLAASPTNVSFLPVAVPGWCDIGGYATGFFGKWHLLPDGSRLRPQRSRTRVEPGRWQHPDTLK